MKPVGVLSVVLFLGAQGAVGALAQEAEAPELMLRVADCGEIDEHALRRLLSIELAAVRADHGERRMEPRQVDLRCEDERALILVVDPASGATRSLPVDLARIEVRGRARMLALTTTELLVASWPERKQRAPSPVARRAPTTMRRRAVAASRPPPRFSIAAFGLVSSAASPHAFLPGGRVRATGDLFGPLGLALDVQLELGEVDTDVADVRISSISVGAAATIRVDHGAFYGTMAAGARCGSIWLQGRPDSDAAVGETHSGLRVGPLAGGALGLRLGRAFFVELGAELFYELRGVAGLLDGDRRLVRTDGTWLTFGLGLGASF